MKPRLVRPGVCTERANSSTTGWTWCTILLRVWRLKLQDRKSQRKILERLYVTPNTRRRTKNTEVSARCARAGRGGVWPKSRCPPSLAAASSSVNISSSRGAAWSRLSAKKVLTWRTPVVPPLDTPPTHWLGQQQFKSKCKFWRSAAFYARGKKKSTVQRMRLWPAAMFKQPGDTF